MNASIFTVDCHTHPKVVIVALVAAITVSLLGINA